MNHEVTNTNEVGALYTEGVTFSSSSLCHVNDIHHAKHLQDHQYGIDIHNKQYTTNGTSSNLEPNIIKNTVNHTSCMVINAPEGEGVTLPKRKEVMHTEITVQGRLLKTKDINSKRQWDSKVPKPKRGNVLKFSRKSRKRLLDLFHTLNEKQFKRVKFLTLTFPCERRYRTERASVSYFRRMLCHIREKFPKSSAIWRIEYQKNGTPHYHIVLFGVLTKWKQQDIVEKWGEIIGYESPIVDIRAVRSFAHLMKYVSKYIAKVPEDAPEGEDVPEDVPEGEGVTSSEDVPEGEGVTSSEDAPEDEGEAVHRGRYWGVFNRKNLPIAEAVIVAVASATIHNNLRRYARRYYSRISKMRQGFTLYVENVTQWLRLIEYEFRMYHEATTYDSLSVKRRIFLP